MQDKSGPQVSSGPLSAPAKRFRLSRYFTATSLVAFAAVAAALYLLESMALKSFDRVQNDQLGFVAGLQYELSGRQEHEAVDDLLRVHEAAHVNLTRVFENVLWRNSFEPLVMRARALPFERCRALGEPGAEGGAPGSPEARRACYAQIGARITSSADFATLDATVHAAMRKTTAFKIKVYDLRGLTVYSSEHRQIGEDKADNHGWRAAAAGNPASELTHRDRFSSFEGVVENRDLISSYVPVRAPDGDKVVGVFEIYSDVTPFLAQIKRTRASTSEFNAAVRTALAKEAERNRREADTGSDRLIAVVGGLLALLYVALLLLVRNAQRIIDQRALEHEDAARREALWHREKMAALATMAANVSHEVGNPLATISALAEEMVEQQKLGACPVCQPREIIVRTRRIAAMTREMADFASTRSELPELVDLNQMVKAMCDFMSFDHRFRITKIEFRPAAGLPGCRVVADRLNEILMTLLHGNAEGSGGHAPPPSRVTVETEARNDHMLVRFGSEQSDTGGAAAAVSGAMSPRRYQEAERLAAGMGARLVQSGSTVELLLPAEPCERPSNR